MNCVKDHEINIGILVIFETLKSLESSYYGCLPQNVKDYLKEFIKVLTLYLEQEDDSLKKYDYDHIEYIKRTYYDSMCFENGGR